MQIHLLSGFLGSGKTTAIQSASRILMANGVKTGVITNDQGIRLVDADLFKHLGIPGRQVINGCFCCNYQDLDLQIQSLSETDQPEVIFAESVGSCTDIIATVLKPLRQYRPQARITLTVFTDALLLHMLLVEEVHLFEDAVQYIYTKQLEEAGLLVLNKVDLLNQEQLIALRKKMQEKYGDKVLHEQHAGDTASVRRWLQLLEKTPSLQPPQSLEIDYPIYGAGEAMLAWLDQELDIADPSGNANAVALNLVKRIQRKVRRAGYPIGHLKFLMNGEQKFSFSSIPSIEPEPEITLAKESFLLLNARVQTDPTTLSALVKESIWEEEKESGVRISTRTVSAFQPGYPTPTYRMA